MALTAQQESILEQIIEAFQNGKRLQDLPDVQGTNPFNLIVEVLDEDGESKKAALATLLPYLESDCSYGVEFDTTVTSPACTRIGNTDLHKSLPIQNRMRGCLLNDNGDVVEYLDPKDWTGAVRDGSRGQVMVEIPMHYRKFETDGTKRRVKISELPLPGYHQVKKQYVSAYQAAYDSTNHKLASVVNLTEQYRGGNNNSQYDGHENSLLGMPATGISRTNFRAYARARKANSTEWNCMTYGIQKALYWLFVVEYATLNSQAAYNAELTQEGYHQGGLGDGVDNLNPTKWNSFNAYNPFIPCGYTDALGNRTGVVVFTMPDSYDTGNTVTTSVPRYRGIENPFAHIFQWTDGINIRINPTAANGGNDKSEVFVCDDPSHFSDSSYDGYSLVGLEARNDGYIHTLIFGEGGEIIPDVCADGGSTKYHCDYHYTSIDTTVALNGVLFGGDAYDGANCGFVSSRSRHAPSYTHARSGSRLCFIPANE